MDSAGYWGPAHWGTSQWPEGYWAGVNASPAEEIPGLPQDFVRWCPIHRVAFDDDPTIYRGAGRRCPVGGELLMGYLARWRDPDGIPIADAPGEDFLG